VCPPALVPTCPSTGVCRPEPPERWLAAGVSTPFSHPVSKQLLRPQGFQCLVAFSLASVHRTTFLLALQPRSPVTPPRPRMHPPPGPVQPVTCVSWWPSQRRPRTASVSPCTPERVSFLEVSRKWWGETAGADSSPRIHHLWPVHDSKLPHSGPQFPYCLCFTGRETEAQRIKLTSSV
jgi:hypothetical protein